MEKGSFREYQDHDFEVTESTSPNKVPIPTQLPEKINLAGLPTHVLRSGAIEALINQNDDLMARLSVSLRRHSLLEEKLSQYQQAKHVLQEKNEALKDQILILEQKALGNQERMDKVEAEKHRQRQDIQLLETRYAELYSTAQTRQKSLQESKDELSRRLSRYMRYRKKIRRAANEIKFDLNETRQALQKHQELLLSEETLSSDLKQKLGQAAAHIQKQAREHEENQRCLVDEYETRLKQLEENLSFKSRQCTELQNNLNEEKELTAKMRQELDDLKGQKVISENKLIAAQRSKQEGLTKLSGDIENLRDELKGTRLNLKEQIVENKRLTEEISEQAAQLRSMSEENQRLSEQVESLQTLWRDNQAQLEKQTEKNASLQKLNQQISLNLNQNRREIQRLKSMLDASKIKAGDKIKELKGQVGLLSETSIEKKSASREALENIEGLIAEIQSGFDKTTKNDA